MPTTLAPRPTSAAPTRRSSLPWAGASSARRSKPSPRQPSFKALYPFVILMPGLGGAWRSLVAHLLWEQGVGGSNPLAPTAKLTGPRQEQRGCSSTVEPQPSKLVMGVRFPSPALAPSGAQETTHMQHHQRHHSRQADHRRYSSNIALHNAR